MLVGFLIRVQGLGTSFYGDEIFHVVTAASLNAGDAPQLAEGAPYTRALPYTRAVAASFRLFGESEWAARLPSLLASLCCIPLVYLLGRRWFGASIGAVAALYLAFEPRSVHFGSFARFYAPVQLAVLVAVLALDRAIVRLAEALDERDAGTRRRALGETALWTLAFLLAMGVGLSMQVLTADVLLGFGVFALMRVAWVLYKGRAEMRQVIPEGILLGAGLLGVGAVAMSMPDFIRASWEVATTTEPWNQRDGLEPLFYAHHLRGAYPLGWYLLPVGALMALIQRRREGLLAVCLFFTPLAAHSLLFRPKSSHYLFPVVPFFFLLAALGVIVIGRQLWVVLSARLPRRAAIVAITLMALFCLRSSPWFAEGMRASGAASGQDWRQAAQFVQSARSPGDLVVGAFDDDFLVVRYYLPSVEAQLATEGWLEETLGGVWHPPQPLPERGVYQVPAWTSAGPVLESLASRPTVWVLARSRQIRAVGEIGSILHEIARQADEITYIPGGVVVLRLVGSPLPPPG